MRRDIYLPYFENKKVTVLGLGLLGRGIGDTAFLASAGADLIVTDKKDKEALASSLDALQKYPEIVFHLGEHTLADFEHRDFVIKAAGVPLDSPYIMHAKERSIPVHMSAALVSSIILEHLSNVTIIGVTGTRGKSTTTYMIHHALTAAGKRAHLGGNVRGVANLPLLEEIEDGDYLVLELDSWQLQGFKELHISPRIAVFTSFLDDHLNYYKGDKEAYFNDKAAIFINQKHDDILIASSQAHTELLKRGLGEDAIVPEILATTSNLIGEHNEVLISLVQETVKHCGVDLQTFHKALTTFLPAEGRLEYKGIFRGVRVYNDNNATTGDATIAAIRAIVYSHAIKPIVIVGGTDKGLDITLLEKEILENTKAYILLDGTGTQRLTLSKDTCFETLDECVAKAFEIAQEGDVLVFSPGFASFSKYFNNEYERNDLFVTLLQKYSK